jgi:hypothetical protein
MVSLTKRLLPKQLLPKRLLRAWAASGLVMATMAGTGLLVVPEAAEALTDEQIVSKLQPVPVFLIVNSEGQPLTASPSSEDTEIKVPLVFLDNTSVQGFLTRAQQEDADAEIALIDLGTLFRETQSTDDEPSPLMYFPAEEELTAATSIQEDFRGVPLFFARQGDEGPYLTITLDGESSLPMFFSRADLQTLIDRYIQENPGAASSIAVEVLSLEWLIAAMSANDDPELDAQLSQIRLFPSSEVLQYLRSQQSEAAPGASGN